MDSEQRQHAEALAGSYVRFRHLPPSVHPTPIRVVEVFANGMIRLEGWEGYFAGHLFEVVAPPKKRPDSFRASLHKRGGGQKSQPRIS